MLSFTQEVWDELRARDPQATHDLAVVDAQLGAVEAQLPHADPSRLEDGEQRVRELSARRLELLTKLRSTLAGETAPAPIVATAAPPVQTYTQMLTGRIEAAVQKLKAARSEGEQMALTAELVEAERMLAAFNRTPAGFKGTFTAATCG